MNPQLLTPGLAILLALLALPVRAELVLGVHPEEPAPSIARLLAGLTADEQAIRVRPFESGEHLSVALQAGEIDLGILEDPGQPLPGVSLVADLYPSVLHVLYRGGETPNDLGELLARGPIWAGPPGSTGHRLVRELARDYGLGDADVRLLDNALSSEPDSYFIFGGILAPDAISRLPGFRLYSLDAPRRLMLGSVAEGIALRYPSLRPFVLPAQLYPPLGDQAALTLSVTTLLAARESLPRDTVYELAMALDGLRPQLAAVYPLAGVRRPVVSMEAAQALPLHEGARRYQDRDLPGFLERYAEVLALGTTVMLATGTILATVRRQRKQSRKDRLDTFYQRLLTLRNELAQPDSNAVDIAHRVRDAQSEVMTLVIGERIDADGSLMAFLTLSNRLLEEAEGPA